MTLRTPTLFVDRDGTLIEEPADCKVDSLSKVRFMPGVFTALKEITGQGYKLVMVTNQDGLGTERFPRPAVEQVQPFVLGAFSSQGIEFDAVFVGAQLIGKYVLERAIDADASAVIGDRDTDLELAANLHLRGFTVRCHGPSEHSWPQVARALLARRAEVLRQTTETRVRVRVNLDDTTPGMIGTGIGFFDHMLSSLAAHGGFSLELSCQGDLEVDEHHTVEDSALARGQALRQALGSKAGIARYGFLLPMDESQAAVSVDLCGRAFAKFNGRFKRDAVGALPTELVPHFFRSLSEGLGAAIHVTVRGENAHHMVEACFKGVGRSLRQALRREGQQLPSTKGVL